MGRAFLF